jgi:replicative DNA helicase
MTGEEILFKCYAILSGVAEDDLRRPGLSIHGETFLPEELAMIERAQEVLTTLPLYVDDSGEHNLQGVLRKIKESTSELIIVDHLHNLSSGNENRSLDLGACTGALKQLAMQKKIPILLVCHLRRREKVGEKSPGPPRLSDLFWSSSIEKDANQVVFIYDRNQDDDLTEISVAKNCHGGKCQKIEYRFEPWCSRITEA